MLNFLVKIIKGLVLVVLLFFGFIQFISWYYYTPSEAPVYSVASPDYALIATKYKSLHYSGDPTTEFSFTLKNQNQIFGSTHDIGSVYIASDIKCDLYADISFESNNTITIQYPEFGTPSVRVKSIQLGGRTVEIKFAPVPSTCAKHQREASELTLEKW